MSDVTLESIVNVPLAKSLFGEPVYGYFRRHVAYSSGRKRGQGHHFVSCDSIPVTEQEYRENVDKSKATEHLRFFSDAKNPFRESYWRYEKRVVTPGWPQVIKNMIEEMEKE